MENPNVNVWDKQNSTLVQENSYRGTRLWVEEYFSLHEGEPVKLIEFSDSGRIAVVVDQYGLELGKKALHGCIVVTVARDAMVD